MAWWDKNHVGWWYDVNDSGDYSYLGCGVLDLPTDTEFSEEHAWEGRIGLPDCAHYWFSGYVEIPGEATIPWEMSQPEVECVGQTGSDGKYEKYPWQAPGTAPVYGPCGSLGGAPNGCNNDTLGSFGDCCPSTFCDTFALGDNAEAYAWPEMPITDWRAGSFQEVAWFVAANHAGGYSYRICKMPEGGIGSLTEECFQENPLEFVGDVQWVTYGREGPWTSVREELRAQQTTEGTFPEGSMWRANPIVPRMDNDNKPDMGHIIDYVHVPAGLEAGEYVVSFRWDSKCSPQVWSSCATVHVI